MNITYNKQISGGARFAAMILDHFFMTMIAMVFFMPGMISGIAGTFNTGHENSNPDFMGGGMMYLSLLGFSIYFCKDCINGRSIAKRILKLQVVDNATGHVAGPLKCLIRNIFIIIWPVEGIIALINPARRIGDRVAGTKLVVFEPALEQPKVKPGQVFISLAIAYGIIFLATLPFKGFFSAMEGQKTAYVESSYNEQAGQQLEQLLTDSLGQYLTPDIKVYNHIENEDLRYISVILRLKENYLEDENVYEKLNTSVINLIFSKYPEQTFKGQLRYIYQTSGNMQSRYLQLGVEVKQTAKQ